MLASTWWRRRRANGAEDDTALGLDVLKTEVIQYSNEPRAKRQREREGRWTMGTPNPPSFRFYRFQQFPNPNDTTKHVDGGAGAQIVAGNAIVLPIMARGGEDKEMSASTSRSTEASRERWRDYQRAMDEEGGETMSVHKFHDLLPIFYSREPPKLRRNLLTGPRRLFKKEGIPLVTFSSSASTSMEDGGG
ncbi:hypothetical protein R3P38DRAFT_2815431 [Favolaschia claudopus]|uniref:Uncharacterized protein n=1 Tax=Favolaschia claudopus TaxID=2862362 RepID=A0AAV9Z1B6_9AGAR